MNGEAMFQDYRKIDVVPMTGAIGAEIFGVDLSKPLADDVFEEIHRAFLDHLVIFFRDQEITPDQQKAFARRFGELHIHPYTAPIKGHREVIEIVKEPDENINWGDGWHTDLVVEEELPMGSILYAKEIPAYGGDTSFSNMYLAYETLSEPMKTIVDGLTSVFKGALNGYTSFRSMTTLPNAAPLSAEHPLVHTHPETGKKSLLLHRKNLKHFKGMSESESKPILDHLFSHAENPNFACRFRWQKGSIAMWDNRCTQHRVTADYFWKERGYEPSRRRMHRVTVRGHVPYKALN